MTKVVSLKEIFQNIDFFVNQAKQGKIFAYPTDTLYGLGGIFGLTLERVYQIKKRDYSKPVSIILPSPQRLRHLPVDYSKLAFKDLSSYSELANKLQNLAEEFWQKQEGVTFVLPLTEPIRPEQYENTFKKSIGVRLINHPLARFVSYLGEPFISTSLNLSGQPTIKDISQLPGELANQIDWIVKDQPLWQKPSVIIDLRGELKIIKRT